MAVSRTRLADAIADRLDGKQPPRTTAKEVAAYLLTEGRTGELDSIIRDIMQTRVSRGIVEVVARTAYPLTAVVRKDVTATIKGHFPAAKQVIISEVHDAEVVAGVRLELANQQLDLSIRSKLNRFKQLTTAGANS